MEIARPERFPECGVCKSCSSLLKTWTDGDALVGFAQSLATPDYKLKFRVLCREKVEGGVKIKGNRVRMILRIRGVGPGNYREVYGYGDNKIVKCPGKRARYGNW